MTIYIFGKWTRWWGSRKGSWIILILYTHGAYRNLITFQLPSACSPLKEKATYKSLTERCLHIPQLFTYTYNVQALPGVMSAFTMKQVRIPLHVKIIHIKVERTDGIWPYRTKMAFIVSFAIRNLLIVSQGPPWRWEACPNPNYSVHREQQS